MKTRQEIERAALVLNLCYNADFLDSPWNTDPKPLGFELLGYTYWNPLGSGYVPCGFVVKDQQATGDRIHADFRGTWKPVEWEADFEFLEETPDWLRGSGARTHEGFTNLEETIRFGNPDGQPLRDFLADLIQKRCDVSAGGHSLGAAEANMTSARVPGMGALLFAGPAVGNQAFEDFAAVGRPYCERIDILSDPILRVPPELFGYARPPLTLALDPAGIIRQSTGFVMTGNPAKDFEAAINAPDHYLDNILACLDPKNPVRPGTGISS